MVMGASMITSSDAKSKDLPRIKVKEKFQKYRSCAKNSEALPRGSESDLLYYFHFGSFCLKVYFPVSAVAVWLVCGLTTPTKGG